MSRPSLVATRPSSWAVVTLRAWRRLKSMRTCGNGWPEAKIYTRCTRVLLPSWIRSSFSLQDLCRVCALPSGHVEEALDYLGCRADVIALDPYSLDDVLETILVVGGGTGECAAHRVRRRLRAANSSARHCQQGGRPAPSPGCGRRVGRPAVYSRTLGAGSRVCRRRRSGRGASAGPLGTDELGRHQDRGSGRHHRCAVWLHRAGAVDQARTVVQMMPRVPVWAIDADGLIVRPGPRVVDGVEALAAALHPTVASPRPAASPASPDPPVIIHIRGVREEHLVLFLKDPRAPA